MSGLKNTLLFGAVPVLGKAHYNKNINSSGRGNYPPHVRDLIQKVGNETIQRIRIMRTPLPSTLKSALNFASFFEFRKRASRLPYDDLFHLFIVIQTEKRSYLLEKNQVINFQVFKAIPKNSEIMEVNGVPQITIFEMLFNTEKRMGRHKYYSYNSRSNNCQDYILNIFRANRIGSTAEEEFVKQHLDELFKGLPIFNKIANTATALGADIDVLIHGEGLRKTPNRWIRHVKAFATKNQISYKNALKHPDCKTEYKK